MNEFDDLDRALCALPLEEPPQGLHQGIMTATLYRPGVPFKAWETWLAGTLCALLVWFALVVHSAPWAAHMASAMRRAVSDISEVAIADSATFIWLAAGVSIVLWVANLDIPSFDFSRRRITR